MFFGLYINYNLCQGGYVFISISFLAESWKTYWLNLVVT